MKWLDVITRPPLALERPQAEALAAYRALDAPDLAAPTATQRGIVVDVESTGLDPLRDRLISIGAIVVQGGLARLDQTFEVVLRPAGAVEQRNIVLHGIGESAQLAGRDPAAGITDFLKFAGKAPLVAFNADFDRILIERASSRVLHLKPANAWLDLALLAPAVFPRHAGRHHTLDDWTRLFGIDNPARHNAAADALATAQLLLVVLAAARAQNIGTWADLIALQRAQRWFGRRRY
jgi:DNA polymerase-3 subunit epsilon